MRITDTPNTAHHLAAALGTFAAAQAELERQSADARRDARRDTVRPMAAASPRR